MDHSSVVPFGYGMSETSLESSNERVQDKRWLLDVKDASFPPEHIAWLRGYERSPDTPLRQTYRRGIVQQDFDPSAPTIHIGIIFLEGADKPTVIHAEMNRETREAPAQKSAEWRVATAATLLKRFEVRDNFIISRQDDSLRILEANKINRSQRRWLSQSEQGKVQMRLYEILCLTFQVAESSNSFLRGRPTGDPIQSLIKRDIQDHVLNIDSDYIHIIHQDRDFTTKYDIISTLIEIDMQSICSLLANFREIISSGGRNRSSKDIIVILDKMINDVRRLCSRSPTIFRLATRSKISKSKDTRYGVNYENVFATMTTSEGIRIFVERSVTFYLSLEDNSTDQEIVRPKFLQMLVVLLALLNDHDLKNIGGFLEETFKIPGDREGLEVLILKVLPLESINSKVFLEDLLIICNHNVSRINLRDPMQQVQQWQMLQQDLAEKGYILPLLLKQIVPDDTFEDDLETLMNRQDLEDLHLAGSSRQFSDVSMGVSNTNLDFQYPRSWMAAWPEKNGIRDSRIFRHIQHCGKLKKDGNFQQETVKAVNNIPHLDVTSEDRDNEYVVVIFANDVKYRVRTEDPDMISAMTRNKYTMKEFGSNSIVDLDIEAVILNGPFIEATKHHNYLVDQINEFLGSRRERKAYFLNKTTPITFTRLEEPIEAMQVSAELVHDSNQRQLCAEAFKLGDRIVFREDILRNMNDILSRLKTNILRIEKAISTYRVRTSNEEIRRMQESHIQKLMASIYTIKTLQNDAAQKRAELLKQSDTTLPSDPISSVIYTSFLETSGEKPDWQPYVSRLHSDGERLLIQSTKLQVDRVITGDVMKLEFHSSRLVLGVQSLNSSLPIIEDEIPSSIREGDLVLWLGYYVVHVEPYATVKNSYIVQTYYRVLSQKREHISRGNQPITEKPQIFILV